MRIEIKYEDGSTNIIESSEEFAEKNYPGMWSICKDQETPYKEIPLRRVSVGGFYDRFGGAKWSILSSDEPLVRAFIMDCQVRKYIDLDSPDVKSGVDYIATAGDYDIDPEKIINAPITENELP